MPLLSLLSLSAGTFPSSIGRYVLLHPQVADVADVAEVADVDDVADWLLECCQHVADVLPTLPTSLIGC